MALLTSTLDGLVGHDIVLPSKGRRLSVCVCMCDDANNIGVGDDGDDECDHWHSHKPRKIEGLLRF